MWAECEQPLRFRQFSNRFSVDRNDPLPHGDCADRPTDRADQSTRFAGPSFSSVCTAEPMQQTQAVLRRIGGAAGGKSDRPGIIVLANVPKTTTVQQASQPPDGQA